MSQIVRAPWPSVMIPVMMLLVAPVSGRADPSGDLVKLCDVYWQGYLKASPTFATSIGDKRYDDRLDDLSPAAVTAEIKRIGFLLERARAIDETKLDARDRVTCSALIEELEGQLARASCHFEDWVVDPLGGPQVSLLNLPDYTTIASVQDADRYVTRCRAMGRYLDQHIANLRSGLSHGRTASVNAMRKTLDQLEALRKLPAEEWALVAPSKVRHDDWGLRDRERFHAQLITTVRTVVQPGMKRYEDFIRDELLKSARPAEKAGLAAMTDGVDCYRKMIRVHTSLDLSPEELHQLGLKEVARIRDALSELGSKVLGTRDVAAIQRRLRSDPAMHFKTGDAVEAKAKEALARARAAIPKYFGVLPKADCVVKVMGMHEAPQSTIAYYRNPPQDGSRPGYYMINTYKPETRPRYEAEALAFHESIPGHHLQIAIAQELTGLPEFRKFQGVTAFVEGWGLYSERLADQMGLYSDDSDRIGMLSYDAWRACRLVVDTGMHAMGWSRQKAIDYMVANTVLAENNIVNEVDRYLTWPGQALAYKVGQLEILRLRDEAEKRLGDRFDIRQFHDAVLENGAVALPVLRQRVMDWVASREVAAR